MIKKLTSQINSLPQKTGVYLFLDKTGRILYVGKAIKLKTRVRSHFTKGSDYYKGDWLKKISTIDWIKTKNEKQALVLENQLIKKYQPRFNVQWRDDKSYFWVSISNEEWPRVKITHQLKTKSLKLKTELIGPFVNGTELKQVLRALRKILPYRTCKNSYNKPCLQWHLKLCPAHRNSEEEKLANSISRHPELGSGSRSRNKFGMTKNEYINSLNTLRQLLRLYAGEKIRVEAYDISNIQGASATGSMIVFAGERSKKSDYRRFRIKSVFGANDIAMLNEVLRRRLNHSDWPRPDLILIDGGRAQLNATQRIIGQKTAAIALAKREEEIYTEYSDKVLSLRSLPLSFGLLFQTIRNEAHRFAITYYRHLHGKKFIGPRKASGAGRKKTTPSRSAQKATHDALGQKRLGVTARN